MAGPDLSLITNAPNLTDRIMQQQQYNAQLQSAQVDTRTKQNVYATQVMSAASASGDPVQYQKGKQLLASQGIDVSNWSDDPAVGAQQAQAARNALISPLGMLNASIQQEKAAAETAGVNGTKAPGFVPVGAPSLTAPVPTTAAPPSAPAPSPTNVPTSQGTDSMPPLGAVADAMTTMGNPNVPPKVSDTIPSSPAASQPLQPKPFVPPPQMPNENQKAYNERVTKALAIKEANDKINPAFAANQEGQTAEAKNAADYKNSLIKQVSENEGAIRIINAQEQMLKNFTPGSLTTDRAAMANFATTLGLPDSAIKSIAGGDPASIQAFQGLASQHALLQLKSLVEGGKINRTEFQGFKEDLANPDKLEGAIRQINQIQKDNYTSQLKELSAMTDWENSGKPLSQFRQNYAQTVGQGLMNPSTDNAPPSFKDPSDPAFAKLPAGSKFIDATTGKIMVKH